MPETTTAIEEAAASVRDLQQQIEDACALADRLRAGRDAVVRAMADDGCSRPEIARLTGLNKSHVRWITERH